MLHHIIIVHSNIVPWWQCCQMMIMMTYVASYYYCGYKNCSMMTMLSDDDNDDLCYKWSCLECGLRNHDMLLCDADYVASFLWLQFQKVPCWSWLTPAICNYYRRIVKTGNFARTISSWQHEGWGFKSLWILSW